MKSFVHFITYNNVVPISLGILFLGAGGALAASPEAQQAVYATHEILQAVDNTKLIATNIDAYNFNVRVDGVTQDDTDYYVDYSYTTLGVSEDVWRDTPKSNHMKISKKSMRGRDLGLYVADQIGQVIDQETSYLKEVQVAEKTKGVTPKVVVVEYSGIVGRMFDSKEKTFPGYVPVVVPEPPPEIAVNNQPPEVAAAAAAAVVQTAPQPPTTPLPPSQSSPSPADIRAMIDEAVKAYLANNPPPAAVPSADIPAPVENPPPSPVAVPDTVPPQENIPPEAPPVPSTPPAVTLPPPVEVPEASSSTPSSTVEAPVEQPAPPPPNMSSTEITAASTTNSSFQSQTVQ